MCGNFSLVCSREPLTVVMRNRVSERKDYADPDADCTVIGSYFSRYLTQPLTELDSAKDFME